MTIHTIIGENEIYPMYLCVECEDVSAHCDEDVYVEGELKKIGENWEEDWEKYKESQRNLRRKGKK